ncbi:MAG: hypothetical protein GWN67_07555 [Phycisphaerae bacterium]|nr:hypothetical protein [Phycisphaerae bacterium]NIS50998.1 hypothetical protein [Phycisphaerae bacterium]NIU08648.1 hypothetical protein [Phycisphaerae bacterium]NIU56231.1 hypothetical protein [Phycisphaerae bacterium]NIV02346.1 hypothetical protein [Phycisphaerae bacterium]
MESEIEVFGNEVVMLMIGVGVLIFIHGNRRRLKSLPASNILITGYCMMLVSWILTVLEGLFGPFWEEWLNYLDHAFYAIGSIFVAVWCWKVFRSGRETGKEAS